MNWSEQQINSIKWKRIPKSQKLNLARSRYSEKLLPPQTGGPEQRGVWKGCTSAVARGGKSIFNLVHLCFQKPINMVAISCLMVDGQVAGEGSSNAHTRGTLERLRRERRDLLNRMKEEVCLFFLLLVFFFFYSILNDLCTEWESDGADFGLGRNLVSLHRNRKDLNSRQSTPRRVSCKWRKCFAVQPCPKVVEMNWLSKEAHFSWTQTLQGFSQRPLTSPPAPQMR